MNGAVLTDSDTIAPERTGEDTTSGYSLAAEAYVYRDPARTWEEFSGYLLLFMKRSLSLEADKQQREDLCGYARALSTLRNQVPSFRVLLEPDEFKAAGPYLALEQLIETYRRFIGGEDDRTSVTHGDVIEKHLGLDRLQVPYHINRQASALLDRATSEAANIVTAVLSDRIVRGLPVEYVDVKPLTDYDAGQWQELVFTIYVDLTSEDANREWDSVLDETRAMAHRKGDATVIDALTERIGVHFRWKISNDVQS